MSSFILWVLVALLETSPHCKGFYSTSTGLNEALMSTEHLVFESIDIVTKEFSPI